MALYEVEGSGETFWHPEGTFDSEITFVWIEKLSEAWQLAKGTRRAELRGERVKRYDNRGLDPWSLVWGAIFQLQDIEADLVFAGADPVLMRREAEQDAYDEFREEVRRGN